MEATDPSSLATELRDAIRGAQMVRDYFSTVMNMEMYARAVRITKALEKALQSAIGQQTQPDSCPEEKAPTEEEAALRFAEAEIANTYNYYTGYAVKWSLRKAFLAGIRWERGRIASIVADLIHKKQKQPQN